jgi:acyl-CoA thioester hydrolase
MNDPGHQKAMLRDGSGASAENRMPHWRTEPIRFADLDPNNHVNNAIFVSLFEIGRVSIIRDPALGLMPDGFQWVVARVAIDFKQEIGWPGKVSIGTGIKKIGRTSLVFEQVLKQAGSVCAVAETVNVFVSRGSKASTEISAEMRAKLDRFRVAD